MATATLAACSSSSPGSKARATAQACGVFAHHYETKQVKIAATVGQRSGDPELARETARLQKDLAAADQNGGLPAIIDVEKMTARCHQMGFFTLDYP